jgi:riboflavin kinase/FMN adenylyltransferase
VVICSTLDTVQAAADGRVVAIGVFDGVHIGHQAIIARAVGAASEWPAPAAVVTFHPHPEVVLRPRSAPRALTPPDRKTELLGEMGVDEVVTVKFDREFARLTPESFCRAVLLESLGTRVVYVGENFRFGRDGTGTVADLAYYGRTHGFTVRTVTLVRDEGGPVSSTRIRVALKGGDVAQAARLLGRAHRVCGLVIEGEGRGRTLGAPTANIRVDRDIALPRLGVYATHAVLRDGIRYRAVTSVGTNPTFEKGRKVRIETLLLDFGDDLYGSTLGVDFVQRIRGQRTFPDAESLREQICRDVQAAKAIHGCV